MYSFKRQKIVIYNVLTVQSVQCSNNISDCPIGFQLTMKTFKQSKGKFNTCTWKVTPKKTQYVLFGHVEICLS